ncbi:MAG: protein kinase [Myxococcales bacterium]|nr:protein kinase [Myxococcales bacterium]
MAGRYRLIERCGTGPSADVYRTHDTHTGAIVAARVQRRQGAQEPAQQRRLADQVRAFHAAAPHKALVPVLDSLDDVLEGRGLVATEFVTTPALPHVLAAGPLQFDAALEAIMQLAALVEHLHARAVLARDLRAGAVFLGVSGPQVVVRLSLDALCPGPVAAPESLGPGERFAQWAAPGYIAPERLKGEAATAASDVYALAALFYEILSSRPAFHGAPDEIVRQHLEAPAPVLRFALEGAPRALEALLAKMFAKVPRFRPTLAEVRQGLDAVRERG